MERFGVPAADLLREAGLTEEGLRDPDARIPLTALARLWRAASTRVADPLLGLRLGSEARARDFGLVGYTLVYSNTLAAALRRLSRYDRILSDALMVQLETSDGTTWVRLDVQPALRAFRPAADARLAALLSICREIAATSITPVAVQFPYRKPADVREYERFFQAPLEFGALATAFALDSADLNRPVALSDDALTGYLDQLASQVLKELETERTVADQVRRVLWRELSERVPEISRVARALALTPRTLQRRLREENTTFSGVLEQLRRDMAPELLRDGRMAVAEVAFLLGYEDASSFHRAFRRWFGSSARVFRRQAS
jgi:AraC-like DNA-binding protein